MIASKFPVALLLLQVIFIILFAYFIDYGNDSDALNPENFNSNETAKEDMLTLYPMFQDVNVMIFFGVGLLYAFLRKYGYSGVGFNMMVAAVAVQWSLLLFCWWEPQRTLRIDVHSLIESEVAAASAVIALGGVFGKTSPLQILVFTLIEVTIFVANVHLCESFLIIADVGYSVSLHMFAGIFGCAVAFTADAKINVQNSPNESTSYESNLFCMIGTLILWAFWPSFNSCLLTGDAQYRCMVNTFLSLIGSCITSFAMSMLLHKQNKIYPSHIQNATLAGGVVIGTVADLMLGPHGALLLGALGGALSVLGFRYVSPFLARMKIYDPCGINSLHALPGLLAGVAGIAAAFIANESTYASSLYQIYPAMSRPHNSTSSVDHIVSSAIFASTSRSPQIQALFQFLYILEVMVVAIFTGLATGVILRQNIFEPLEEKHIYLDEMTWIVPESKCERKGQN